MYQLEFQGEEARLKYSLLNIARTLPAVCFRAAIISSLPKFRYISLKIICWQSDQWGLLSVERSNNFPQGTAIFKLYNFAIGDQRGSPLYCHTQKLCCELMECEQQGTSLGCNPPLLFLKYIILVAFVLNFSSVNVGGEIYPCKKQEPLSHNQALCNRMDFQL